MPVLEGVAIGLGRYPVHKGRTVGKTRTFAIVLVDTRTEKWIMSGGKYKGGHRVKARCQPDFRVAGQTVKVRVPDTYPDIEHLVKAAGEIEPASDHLSKVSYIPYIIES
jgi:hypothetical protein